MPVIRQSFSFQPFPVNAFPMSQPSIRQSFTCQIFVSAVFIKVLPHQSLRHIANYTFTYMHDIAIYT